LAASLRRSLASPARDLAPMAAKSPRNPGTALGLPSAALRRLAESSDSDRSSVGGSIAIDASLSNYRALERGASAAMWAVRVDSTTGAAKKGRLSSADGKKKQRQQEQQQQKKKKKQLQLKLQPQQSKHAQAAAAPNSARVTARERRARAAAMRAQTRPSSARR
jgi:uncharacterized protein YlxW (UPF0749 family)